MATNNNALPNGWREVRLGELIEIFNGVSYKSSELKDSKTALVTLKSFARTGGFSPNGYKEFIGDYKKQQVVESGDLIVACTDLTQDAEIVGNPAIVEKPECYQTLAISLDAIKINILNQNTIDKKYLYYSMKTKSFKGYCIGNTSGTTVMHMDRKSILDYEMHLPPIQEQRAIAEVLSSLDDKIDLLHRQNQTLEDMAQALFRRWFVEEANPDWDEVALDDIAHYLNGLACQKHPPKNNTDKLPVLKIRELKSGISNSSDWATSHVDKKYIVTRGDVIFSWSASLVVKIWDGETCVLNQHLFKITSEKYPKWFYYLWTKYHVQKFISIANSKSTTMGHIKREDLTSAATLVPPEDELKRMTTRMSPLFDKMTTNQEHIQWLVQTRDRLLPNLINGKIRLNTA